MRKDGIVAKIKRAYVVGFYGMSNFGDDLFCEVITDRALELFPNHRAIIVGDTHNRLTRSAARKGLSRKFFAAPNVLGSSLRLIVALVVLVRGDMLVLGGGSVLSRLSGVRAIQWRLARYTRTSFQALGVSLGPFQNDQDKRAVGAFAGKLERIVVRDSASYGVGTGMGLGGHFAMGGDLAALSASIQTRGIVEKRESRRIGLALCNFNGFGDKELEDVSNALAESLKVTAASAIGDSVTVFSLNNHSTYGDDALSMRAVEILRARGVVTTLVRYEDIGVQETLALISSLDAMVAVRLHAAICAYLSDVPFAMLEYHVKCSDFSDDIGQDTNLRFGIGASQQEMEVQIHRLLSNPAAPSFPPCEYKARAESVYLPKCA